MPHRSVYQREPVRVINAAALVLEGLNALLLGVWDDYNGATAAAVTAFLAILVAAANELFVRSEVVPLKPLQDLADAETSEAA